jgi:hypothetical protein
MKTMLHRLYGYGWRGVVPVHSGDAHVCRCLKTCSSGLGKRGWQHRGTAFLVLLLEYRVTISRVKTQGLAFIGCERIIWAPRGGGE